MNPDLVAIQRRVGATPDGLWGPATAAAINKALSEGVEESVDTPRSDLTTALAVEHLRREEGTVLSAYQDHLGYWTIGTGRLIDKRRGGGISQAENDILLANDIAKVRKQLAADLDTAAAWARVKDDPVRAVALISMGFQMGVGLPGKDEAGLSGFDGTLALIAAGDFGGAAAQALKSQWAKQTPARAKRVTEMLRTGEMK